MEDFFVHIRFRNKTIKFKISDPNYEMEQLMNNLKNAADKTGKRFFNLPEMIDFTPTELRTHGRDHRAMHHPATQDREDPHENV